MKKVKFKIKNAAWMLADATHHHGRAALPRRPNFCQDKRSEVLTRVTASLAALAGGEIGTEPQLCPTALLLATSEVQPGRFRFAFSIFNFELSHDFTF